MLNTRPRQVVLLILVALLAQRTYGHSRSWLWWGTLALLPVLFVMRYLVGSRLDHRVDR